MSLMKKRDEKGVVSLLITIVMIAVISLIVIGFTQSTTQNRRQALDKQLSDQAFYAAESGLNDTVNLIRTRYLANQTISAKSDCDNNGDYASLNGSKLLDGGAGDVAYTCVLVDPTVSTLQFSANQSDGHGVYINANDTLKSLLITWNNGNYGLGYNTTDCSATTTKFPASMDDCPMAVLRIDLMVQNAGTNANSLNTRTTTLFLIPSDPASQLSTYPTGWIPPVEKIVTFGSPQVSKVAAPCVDFNRNTNVCVIQLSFPSAADQATKYYARFTSIYSDASVVQLGGTTTSNSTAKFSGQQVVVDVTGKAQGVLRRIQARVPLTANGASDVPLGAIESTGDICKQFSYTLSAGNLVTFNDNCSD